MAQIKSNYLKAAILFGVAVIAFLGFYIKAQAVSTLLTSQGGTGTTSPSGIIYGDNGASTAVKTVTIGTNLTFAGGTLSATGGGGSGTVGTSSSETANRVPFWTTTSATPALLSGGSANFTFNSSTNLLTVTGNASTTQLTNSGNTWLATTAGTNVGIGSTSPWGMLSVHHLSTSPNIPHFVVASSTATATTTEFIVASNGNVGVGTTSPMSLFAVAGPVQAWTSSPSHFGSSCGNGGALGVQGVEVCGTDNTVSGVQAGVTNINAGSSAYAGLYLNSNLADSTVTHFGGLFLNSSAYTDTTFGTAFANKSMLALQNTDGLLSLISSTSTEALNPGGINFVTGGTSSNNERVRITVAGKVGIGTTTPTSILDVTSTSTSATGSAFSVREKGTKILDVASTSNISYWGVGTTSQATVDTVFAAQGNSSGSATKGTCFRGKDVGAATYTYWWFKAGVQTVQTTSCSGVGTTTVTFD